MGKPPGSQSQFYHQSTTVSGTVNQSSTSINHFSHPHALHITSIQPQQGFTGNLCSGCKHEASGVLYTCTACNYSLHQKCSQMPQQITHPFDANNHVLHLLDKPAYPEGIFKCDGCGEQGNGFSYHCQTCGIDLHALCACLPLVYTHQSHHHKLNLTFSPPYPGGTFSCDICRTGGSNTWLYRCNICEFDVHLTCVNALPSNRPVNQPSLVGHFQSLMSRSSSLPPPQTANMGNNFPNNGINPVGYNSFPPPGGFSPFQPQPQLQTVSRVPVANPYAVPNPMQQSMPQNNFMHTGSFGSPVMPPGYGQPNTMTGQIVGGVANGLASGASQAAVGALIQGMFGGGGGGGGGGVSGGEGNGVSGFTNSGDDVIQVDPGSSFVSDGSFTQTDGGGYGGDSYVTTL